ncbi:glycoside hydrolase family 3 protein [Leptothoe kymatousa]|uniref:Exo 1,3/1,4-beta-D-glucan glucohydrolase n=1 Tax=Leptothoe kymatousa TAU-MAC 1615 TaxID=2364775 RepID=A0ABS5Y3M0_9CYAN|nr:exo 1,3/1,4-beta-D-glucan glucohydrolase [Leptothoe kymatousa]MBT9311575.1 exo 1,3/1,4-beta-D-glucan glucohydrolase [Leptothoe kymatousa TAU-MAC 1615]
MKLKMLGPLLLLLVLGGFAAYTAASSRGQSNAPGTISPKNWPTTTGGAEIDPAIEQRITELMATMTIEEMVGQTIQADISSVTPEDVRRYRLGSVLNGGNSAPQNDVRAAADKWLALADEFYTASMDTTNGHTAIPILWGTDAVHGHNNIIGATIFPHNIGLGATHNPALMQQIGEVTAREVIVTGMDWTFAPTLAVVRDNRWGRTYESYSEDPDIVAKYSSAVVQGLQGELGTNSFLNSQHVIATAKHFLGDGGTQDGKDQGNNIDSEADLRDYHGAGYPPALDAGVQTVMASFSSWQGIRMHGHKGLLTDVLKKHMGFNGFVVGDWNGHGQILGCTTESCPIAFNAGIDMFMAPDTWEELYTNTLAQVKSGEIPKKRLEDAVRRILRVKFRLGLFEKPKPSDRPLAGKYNVLGNPNHQAIAQQAVRESLVLLKNQENLLPLRTDQTILVTGDGAHNIGKQTGGWTLSWQGTGNSREHFPNGTSIWEGLQTAIEAGGGTALLSEDGSYSQKPDVAIVVFGEDPYAEFKGDIDHLDYTSDQELQQLQSFQAQGISTVAVFLSGRPLWVAPEMNASDAFVAAWLPGSAGNGIADVLVRQPNGDINHDFKGKLSFSWPRTAIQTKVNRGDENYDPLFPYGYGLTYQDNGNVAKLPEISGLDGSETTTSNALFAYGKPIAPWSIQATAGDTASTVVDARTQLGEAITIRAIDRDAQEDAQQFVWSGEESATVAIAGPATDYTAAAHYDDLSLVIQYRVDTAPAGAVTLFAECGDDCRAELDMTQAFTDAPVGEWTEIEIALSSLVAAGADMGQLTALGFETGEAFSLSISDMRLTSK